MVKRKIYIRGDAYLSGQSFNNLSRATSAKAPNRTTGRIKPAKSDKTAHTSQRKYY